MTTQKLQGQKLQGQTIAPPQRRSPRTTHDQPTLGRLRQRRRIGFPPVILLALVVILLFVLCAIFAPWLAPHDPIVNNLRGRLSAPEGFGGAQGFILGSDALGRDLLSRLIYGARVSLSIGFVGTLIGVVTGGLCGLIAGYVGGVVDEVMMFLVDAYIALPFLVIALTVIAILGNGLAVLVILAGFSGWASYTRLMRGQVLAVRGLPYIQSAHAIGVPPALILLRHVLPNVAAPLIVLATLGMTSIILLEASLSFLGLGIQPPTPAWGAMLGDGRNYLHTAWWIAIFPGAALMLLTMSISLVGDWLRDVLDPTLGSR
jgi:peptide/nickel transport system permease protein